MKKTNLLATATTSDGQRLTLHEHDGDCLIRVGGVELMSTRQHQSEERIAQLACAHLGADTPGARVLIGGLGLGFTLRAALACLAPDARVVVAELMPEVIEWNRVPEYRLGAEPMSDSRVEVVCGDVADLMRTNRGRFDAIILDVDNGARGLSTSSNDRLYQMPGLSLARSALKADGCLAVWSASPDRTFVELMGQCGFDVTVERERPHPGSGGWHFLFIGRVQKAVHRAHGKAATPGGTRR